MIHQVAIKSLPQEWLWCETWCSDDEKPRAKTIDLVCTSVTLSLTHVCVMMPSAWLTLLTLWRSLFFW